MTREEAIANLNMISVAFVEPVTKEQRKLIDDTFEMAIQALSQEPICDRDCEHCTWTECPIEPCDDAISREYLKKIAQSEGAYGYVSAHDIATAPSVTQKSGKWDRLYSWLNDMRLGIAPDETVYDDTERVVRESQVDILDEIMEWMIKAEVEPQESEEQTE